jgi:hypothetical protein
LPRDLADVLHYFLPDADDASQPSAASGAFTDRLGNRALKQEPTPSSLPILGIPIGERDVVRAALAWNLAIETARLGGSTVMLAPTSDEGSPLWPEPGMGPLGTELVLCPAADLESLYRVATDLAKSRAGGARRGGIIFVRIPPSWLTVGDAKASSVSWLLLLTSANRRDLHEAHDLARTMWAANPCAEVGVTIHGVKTISEARGAFEYLSRISEEQLGLVLASYGLLVDDLHVYRAIAAQRPIGLAHPQAPATRALMDVARLLYEDARSRVLG